VGLAELIRDAAPAIASHLNEFVEDRCRHRRAD
jgi:hypothetical protein